MAEWKCVQCGKCCFMYGTMIPATDQDMERWEKEGRNDILDRTKVIRDPATGRIIAAELWFDPYTGKSYAYCPWIKRKKERAGLKQRDKSGNPSGDKVYCQIHDTKPQYCRDYICRRHLK
ncbi:MAG: hypothetical protein DRO99_02055 [Candidatus Aenigmatarchaeota archaeon]|nr:MAG: hypothetical protein DRO99_02055 [Candidatus Aenigmarchaeota archaeon]